MFTMLTCLCYTTPTLITLRITKMNEHNMKNNTVRYYLIFLSIVFFNAFLDLGHKVLIQNTFFQTCDPRTYTIMTSIVNALILLPYIFFFSPSGFIADKFAKANVLRITAIAAIPLTILITCFYYLGFFWCAFSMTALLGVQSAINSPAKYGYIKELFGKNKIAQANGFVQTIIIIAILAGTFLFSILFQYLMNKYNIVPASHISKSRIVKIIAPTGFLLILSSCLESILTFFIPVSKAADADSTFSIKQYAKLNYVTTNVKSILSNETIFICILALSFFWGVNQVILANYGAYLKEYVHIASNVFAQGSLAIGGIGIFLGALYAGYISKNFIETGVIPIAVIGMTIGLFFMPLVHNKYFICILFLLYGICSGMLLVPLNALIQFISPHNKLGKILAGNNFAQNIFMVVFLLVAASLAFFYVNSIMTFRVLFILSIAATIYSLYKLPQSLIRYITFALVSKLYKISAFGIENIPSDKGALLLGNHVSYLDWAILQITSPRQIRFVMERRIYNKWYLNWVLKRLKAIPISSKGSKQSLSLIKEALQQGDLVALFPEGFLSRSGHLGKFNRGFELAIQGTDAVIVPFYIRGLWGSYFSLASAQYKKASKNKKRLIEVCYGKTLPADTSAAKLKEKVFELSHDAWARYAEKLPTIQQAWIKQAKQAKKNMVVAESNGKKLNGYEFIGVFLAFKKLLQQKIANTEQRVGIILPPSIAGAAVNLALLALGKTVVNLNYTAQNDALLYSAKNAEIKTIFTSQIFVKKLAKKGCNLDGLFKNTQVIFLEDYKNYFSKRKIMKGIILAKFIPLFLFKLLFLKKTDPENTAVIYFSSGSEGKPKGVELTHKNIVSNIKQVTDVLGLRRNDVMLGCLPLFHAFGLTVTTFMPLLEEFPVVFYPDPTDAVGIGKTVAKFKVKILCGTSTFLNFYTRQQKLHALMFKSLRMVVAGAEKLSPAVREAFQNKFGVAVLEGYGATETAPVVSVNIPDILIPAYWHVQVGNKLGTVGMPLPGTSIKIVDPDTLKILEQGEKGMIMIAGPQIMKGYLNDAAKTNSVLVNIKGTIWYLTGDQGYLDEDGFLAITDRYSRFAKVGGEMVSLTAVENAIRQLLDADQECVIVSLPDEKRGEKIILLVTKAELDLGEIIKNSGLAPIMMPSKCYVVENIPKLGSGKIDLTACKEMAMQLQQKNHD